ncbi:unnamed protein product [Allacma fusca]|uniref:Zinc finger CCCH domain-containing protein 14 n=1 Tax=Allacma fusca TaxID=39272 RepID=A0A8J2PUZ3_9HEXA|nr:unnamed protein product [Allacma fusca]
MELDVSKKVRTAIKAKLLELGVHVDEELPDYIMILIANRRSKEQMEEDLGLFLSENTLKFTSWLHQVLKKLQEVTTSAPAVKSAGNAAPAVVSAPGANKKPQEEPPRPEKIVDSKVVTVKTAPVPKEVETKGSSNNKRRKVESEPLKETQGEEEESKSPTSKKLKISRQPVISPVKSDDSMKRQPPEENWDLEVSHPPNRSKSPVSAPASRRIEKSRSPVKLDRSPTTKKGRNSPVSVPSKRRYSSSQRDRSSSPGFKKSIRNSRKSSRSRSRSGSPTTKARKSLRSLVAVVKRHNELNALKDEEYNPNRPQVTSASVASVVHVTPRPKRATKQEGGSNKLLFRALADAQKSIASHSASAKVLSGDKDKEKNDTTESTKFDSKQRKSSESSNSKSVKTDEERSQRTEAKTNKPSIKDRLGYRLGTRVPVAQRLADAPRHQDLESEEYADDFLPDGEDNYKSIIINVPTSKDSKERSVHLEDESKRSAQGSGMEEPKRLSIQVNVDSDDTSSSEDELEIQPGPSEDLNLEPKDTQAENKELSPGSNRKKEESSESEEEARPESVRSHPETGKSSPNEESSSKELLLDETSKHSEELEIEEYEEIEEEEDDEEYDVVIQERNIALPDPGEYDSGRKDKNDMEVENEAAAMDITDSKDCNNAAIDMEDGGSPENVRYPLNLRSFNHGDTKFVVTMDGTDDPYYSNEELMETNDVPLRGTGDLRHRISRSILASKVYPTGLSPPAMPAFHQARPFLPITGAPRPFSGPVTSVAAAPQCKYWPECTFKDKCIYPHPKCKFGENCTKPQCPYKHDSGVFGNGSGSNTEAHASTKGSNENNEGKIQCKFFPKCHSMSCQFYHPSPCRFGVGCTDAKLGCTDAKCKNFHPGQTVGQQRSKNKLFGAVTRPKSYRAPPPAAHLLRWKAPSASSVPVLADNKQGSIVDDSLTGLVDASASTA